MTTNRSKCLWVMLLLLAIGSPSAAAERQGPNGELGFLIGVGFADADLAGEEHFADEMSPLLGIRGGWRFADRWIWFGDVTYGQYHNSVLEADIRLWEPRTGLELLFGRGERSTWFGAASAGLMYGDFIGDSFSRGFGSIGLGQRWDVGDRSFFRWEVRGDGSFSDDGLNGRGITNAQLLLGWSWGLGGAAADADGDGVSDRKDKCPNTPKGALVDETGCPKDSDGDGVYDGIDACPDTTKGWPVDGRGCPKDTDGDGVSDGADSCPNTPKGAKVDAKGCPTDSDGDGVADGIDKCPNTPKGATVDASGCPVDSDGDGVPDGIDKCPNTPRGSPVDASGCPQDSDGDGVPDGIDKCPNTPRGTKVDASGCPPAPAALAPLMQGKTVVLEGVNFETNSTRLTSDSRTVLDKVAASLLEVPDVKIEIQGHTDATGGDTHNMKLSQSRAEAVQKYLAGRGVADSRMVSKGYGETQPIADNETADGRAKNRRVELKKID